MAVTWANSTNSGLMRYYGVLAHLGDLPVKKGRHRRFEEARALKRGSSFDFSTDTAPASEPCPECDSAPGAEHASWCMYTAEEIVAEEQS